MTTPSTELATTQQQLTAQPSVQPAEVLGAIVAGGVTPGDAATLREVMVLMQGQEDRQARKSFGKALSALQAETSKIKADATVPNRDGTARYKYATMEAIMDEVQPILTKYGFSVWFDVNPEGDRMKATCHLMHEDGHEIEVNSWHKISGPPGGSATQADSGTITTAKRYALCAALNIRITTDDDAGAKGSAITAEQADELERLVQETGSDKAGFLRFAGAASFREILSSRYAECDRELRKKKRKTVVKEELPL